jgi:hypothetical protein
LSTIDKEAVLSELKDRYGIKSKLIQIPVLARIVGMKKATLYLHAREGFLFVPCRYINKTPLVDVDDLADWLISTKSPNTDKR